MITFIVANHGKYVMSYADSGPCLQTLITENFLLFRCLNLKKNLAYLSVSSSFSRLLSVGALVRQVLLLLCCLRDRDLSLYYSVT